MYKLKKSWREAATLIIVASTNEHQASGFNYKILMLKRSDKTSYMKGNISFGGGAIDDQDIRSSDWITFFNRHNLLDKFDKLKVYGERQFIFHKNEPDELPREISLRITVIRETFEELGVLICRPRDELFKHNYLSSATEIPDLKHWQKLIHEKKKTFIQLCETFNLVPDLWRLYEWANWLTPTFFNQRRYDSIFFIVGLPFMPNVYPELHEVADYIWADPKKYLEMHREEKVWLPPPQTYELSRLLQIKDAKVLVQFANKRNSKGLPLFMPVQYFCNDGMLLTLPGDELYPTHVKYEESERESKRFIDENSNYINSKAKFLNRLSIMGTHNIKLLFNLKSANDQLDPVSSSNFKL